MTLDTKESLRYVGPVRSLLSCSSPKPRVHSSEPLKPDLTDPVVTCTQAFFFFCQNNLSFIALMYLSNSAFQLLLNCRIVMVAISTILVLGKPINSVEWVAVILLTTGAVQYNL
eukprot:COSAG02_NODE_30158_length_556_cov_0.901532_1_plen_113_part_01